MGDTCIREGATFAELLAAIHERMGEVTEGEALAALRADEAEAHSERDELCHVDRHGRDSSPTPTSDYSATPKR